MLDAALLQTFVSESCEVDSINSDMDTDVNFSGSQKDSLFSSPGDIQLDFEFGGNPTMRAVNQLGKCINNSLLLSKCCPSTLCIRIF